MKWHTEKITYQHEVCVCITFTAFGHCLGLRVRNRGSILTIGIQVLIMYSKLTQSAAYTKVTRFL